MQSRTATSTQSQIVVVSVVGSMTELVKDMVGTADRLNPQILCSSCRVVSLMSKLVFENGNPSRTAIRRNLNSLSQYLDKFEAPTVKSTQYIGYR